MRVGANCAEFEMHIKALEAAFDRAGKILERAGRMLLAGIDLKKLARQGKPPHG